MWEQSRAVDELEKRAARLQTLTGNVPVGVRLARTTSTDFTGGLHQVGQVNNQPARQSVAN